MTSSQKNLALMLGAGAAVAALFYILAVLAGRDGYAAVPQPDTPLYMQYARHLAEGQPYVFFPGDAPSTGSTSHLYPAALALLYKLGARGPALLTAGFVFQVGCWFFFLFNWWRILKKLLPDLALPAGLMVALSGHAAFCFFAQSDIGLFSTLATWMFAEALEDRYGRAALGLFLCVWCRPEGMLMTAALALVGGVRALRTHFRERRLLAVALAGAAAGAGVFALNWLLTGDCQFQSVSQKGLWKELPPLGALYQSLYEMLVLFRETFLGITSTMRQHYFVPVLSGLLGLYALFTLDWKHRVTAAREAWWLLSAVATLGLVALSGWQMTNLDRYFAWVFPLWTLYILTGVQTWSTQIGKPAAGMRLAFFLVAYQALNALFLATAYYDVSKSTQTMADFASEADAQLPQGSRVGFLSMAGMAYFMDGRSGASAVGIVSPQFVAAHLENNLERLKHHPGWRFDYWFLTGAEQLPTGLDGGVLMENRIPTGQTARDRIVRATWDTLNEAFLEPQDPAMRKRLKGLVLADRLDIGYPEDETRGRYRERGRFQDLRLVPFLKTASLGKKTVSDVGRLVLGSNAFVLKSRPGRPLLLVLRTAESVEARVIRTRAKETSAFALNFPFQLHVTVDGQELGVVTCDSETESDSKDFREVAIEIPADFIRRDETELELVGDHAAFIYWAYQPE